MFYIYSLLYSIALLVILPFEYLKRPKGLRSRWLRERFGFLNSQFTIHNSQSLWVHAVSVGEVISAVPFMKELRKKYPSLHIILSTVTDTGQKVAREKAADIADIVYLPFDLTVIIRRVMKRVNPAVFIVMETELWPNILRAFRKENVPVLLMNGRISDDSFKGYRRIRFFMKEVLGCVDFFGMQEEIYRERIMALGADEKKVRVLGNFKFDIRPSERLPRWSSCLNGPIILAGSTHEGEEELMVSVYERLRIVYPELNLILAPRHPERFGKVEEIVKARGMTYIKRSRIDTGEPANCGMRNTECGIENPKSGVVFLLDTIGELGSAYGIADVAVMGGSFSNHGGHNPLEPAFWGRPVVCGPHMENFPFVQEFFIGSGAIKTDSEGLYDVLRELLRSVDKRMAMGERARYLYREKAGAVKRAVDVLEGYLDAELLLSQKESLS